MSFSPSGSPSGGSPVGSFVMPALAPRVPWLAWLWAHARLARPSDTALAFIGTVVGAGLSGIGLWSWPVLGVAVSNALLSGASMMFNDWHDVEEDRINCPGRPIPSGVVPGQRALVMAVATFLAGVATAAAVGSGFGWRALAVAGASVAYSSGLKRWPLVGNATTALLSSYPIWCWAFDVRPGHAMFWLVAAAYFVGTIGKEIVRTAADLPGDRAAGIRTIGAVIGPAQANWLGASAIGLGLAIIWVPIAAGLAGEVYTLVVVMSTVGAVAFAVPRLRRYGPSPETSREVLFITRTVTVLVALAIVLDLLGGSPGI
jgi:4-hydroxybenzoate polyprenyltransferase